MPTRTTQRDTVEFISERQTFSTKMAYIGRSFVRPVTDFGLGKEVVIDEWGDICDETNPLYIEMST